MAISKFEKQALKEINRIDEKLTLSLFKFFLKPKVKKALKALSNDPEMKALQSDVNRINAALKDRLKNQDKYGNLDPRLAKLIKNL